MVLLKIFIGILFLSVPLAGGETGRFPCLALYDGLGGAADLQSGKNQFVFLGFQTKAKAELIHWYHALMREKAVEETVQGIVLGVFPSWMSWAVIREPLIALCRKMSPKEVLPNLRITFYDKEKLSLLLGLSHDMEALDHIHVFFLDSERRIKWHGSGFPTPELLAQLRAWKKLD